MRSTDDYRRILELHEAGHNKSEIARITGIPRATIRDCIKRFGSLDELITYERQVAELQEGKVVLYRQILTLWEDGKSKSDIERITEASKHTVRLCIESFRSLKVLEDTIQNQGQAKPKVRSYAPKTKHLSEEEIAQLREIVATSTSYSEVLRRLNIKPGGGNHTTLKKRIASLKIDVSHFKGKGWSNGHKSIVHGKQYTLEEILVENSTYTNTNQLRKRLLAEGIFEHRCQNCERTTWLDQPIPLELDHINGDRRDHRLENLRLLCPNCHALTPTYRGKNRGN